MNALVPIEEYLVTETLDLDLAQMKRSCARLHDYVTANITAQRRASPQRALDENVFGRYNVFHFPFPGFHALFREIARCLGAHRCCDRRAAYHVQSWLNVFHGGETVGWHRHWKPEARSFHGFYCVDVKGSSTEYRFIDRRCAVEIVGVDNTLVLGPAEGDVHRTTPRKGKRPRITIAFDIVPQEYLETWDPSSSNWVPLVLP
jgi:hypothetical protein